MSKSGLTSNEILIADIANGIATGLSLFGSLFMIITYCRFHYMRTFPMKLVMSLVGCDLISTLSNILFYINNNTVCIVQGLTRTFSFLSSNFWALIIAYITYTQVKGKSIKWNHYYRVIFSVIMLSALVPIAVALTSHFLDGPIKIQKDALECALSPVEYDLLLKFIPIWISLILIAVISFKTRGPLQKLEDLMEEGEHHEYGRIFWYPIILFIIWIPSTMFHLYQWIAVDNPGFVLELMNVTFNRLMGFVNFIAYGWQYLKLREYMKIRAESHDALTSSEVYRLSA